MKTPQELPARPVRDLINRQCFISYSWDSSHHKDWVRQLAKRLVEDGIPTSLDQWDLTPGMDVPNYVETRIRESEFVLLVCTPSFARKADSIRGGVGYEKTILTGGILQGIGTDKQLIPIIRSGTPKTSLPSYLKSKYFIDFRQDTEFEIAFDELLRSIAKAPRYVRPELGTIPSLRPIEFTAPNKKLSKTISLAANKSKSPHSLPTKKVFKPPRDKQNYTKSVFLNCPTSDDYSPLLKAIVFTVTILGFRARSPLEINAGSARFQKLYTLISGCKYGIHDVSQPKRESLRLNPAFELGLFMGAQRFDPIRKKHLLVLDSERYRYQQVFSDLSGSDVFSHNNKVSDVVTIVRNWLASVSGEPLPSGALIYSEYRKFMRNLPKITNQSMLTMSKLTFVDFTWIVAKYIVTKTKA